MASFTDQIMQFNPYVKQLPTEAMAKVGMYKQQKYEEGVQKIQSEIDRIAGLDVVRDVDKQYLQSKLNELGNNLKTVAAGDFSNFQLVNSVGGMATQIGKDKNVQNAVSSTAKYRKSISEIEAARKEGKSSPSNEYVFNQSANEWLTSKDINASFTGSYKPYTNWKKEAVEVLKSLTKDSTITENMFTADGKLADYVVKNKFAGISPEKIQEALLVGLTPAAMEQMQIDGIYSYANKTPEEFKATIYNDFKERADHFINQRNALENAKSNNTTSGEEKQKLNQQIASLDKIIDSIQSQYSGLAESLEKGNVDAAKASLFTANQITNFAKAFSYTETEQTYGQNYAAEMAFKREQANKDWQKFTLTYNQTERWKKKEYDQEERKIKAEASPMYGGLPQPVSQEDLPKITLGNIVEQVNKTKSQLSASDADFAKRNNKDPNKSNDQWLAEQRDKWQEGKVDPKIAAYFNQTEGMRRNMEVDQKMILDIQKDAKNKTYVIDGKKVSAIDLSTLIPAGTKGLSFKTGSGRTLNFTPEEIVEFNAKKNDYISSTKGGAGVAPTTTVDYQGARKNLSDKEYTLFSIFTKQGSGIPGTPFYSSNKTPEEQAIISKIQEVGKLTTSKYNKLISAQSDYIADEVTKRVTNMQGVSYDFPVAKPEQKSAIAAKLNQFADFADKQKGKFANSPDFTTTSDLRKIASDVSSVSMTLVEGTSYAQPMYEISAVGKDGLTTKFRISPEQKASVFGNLFEAPPQVQAFRPYQEIINKNGGYTTAPNQDEKTSWTNSKLGKIDFPYVNSFGVTGNIENVSPGQYSIRLNIKDPRTGDVVEDVAWPQNSLATEKEAMFYLQQINDNTAFQLMYGKTPSAAELKQLQKAKDKPF